MPSSPSAGQVAAKTPLLVHVLTALVALLASLYLARGSIAILTGSFEGSSRHGGPYKLAGRAAELMGASHALLGVFLLLALAAWLRRSRALAGLAAAACIGALACIGVGVSIA